MQVAPPLTCGQAEFDEIEGILRHTLTEATTDDHSYTGATAAYRDAPQVTAYANGVLSWGTEP